MLILFMKILISLMNCFLYYLFEVFNFLVIILIFLNIFVKFKKVLSFFYENFNSFFIELFFKNLSL